MTSVKTIQDRFTTIMLYGILAHVPVILLIGGLFLGSSLTLPAATFSALVGVVCFIMVRQGMDTRAVRLTIAVAAMSQPALLVLLFAGHPWQIDMHMYFFAALAVLAGFCDWRVIIAATSFTAVHHLMLNFLLPTWVFPESASFIRVILHALVLLLEAGTLTWLCQQLAASFSSSEASEAAAKEESTKARDAAVAAQKMQVEAETALKKAESAQDENRRLAAAQEATRQETARNRERELHALSTGFDAKVTSLLAQVEQSIRQVEDSANRAVSDTNKSQDELRATNRLTRDVAQGVQSVAVGAEEVAQSVREISQQVAAGHSATQDALSEAEVGRKVIGELAERAEQIGSVITMIDEISRQTNLLALNATIEAARAGKAGLGFGVVANEVKTLAGQAAKATEQIADLVKSMQTSTGSAVDALENISNSMTRLSHTSNAIASAVEEQDAATQEIARGAREASSQTQEAAERVTHATAGLESVAEASKSTQSSTDALKDKSDQLSKSASSFVRQLGGERPSKQTNLATAASVHLGIWKRRNWGRTFLT